VAVCCHRSELNTDKYEQIQLTTEIVREKKRHPKMPFHSIKRPVVLLGKSVPLQADAVPLASSMMRLETPTSPAAL